MQQDQYNRRNNLEIHGITSTKSGDSLAEKVIQIFEGIDISVTVNDFEDFHRLGKSGNNTIVRLENKRTCKKVLKKWRTLTVNWTMQNWGFIQTRKIFLSENITTYKQHLA